MSDLITPGSSVARYRIQAEIGRGGMGVVYRAVDPLLHRPVALKVLAPHMGRDPQVLARFHREAASIANLRHPHIAVVYEFGEQAGQPFIALEWLEGRTLQAILAEAKTLAPDRALQLFNQLAGALDYAHAHGVIHRDIKPANIIVGAEPGGGEHATLVDFGLAHMAAAPAITASTDMFGSPAYMSPEQVMSRPMDGRSDLYSLAVVLYEMLAGRLPFDAVTAPALLHAHLYDQSLPITEVNPEISPAVERALLKALAKEPAERFATAAEFGAALRGAEPALAAPHMPESAPPRLVVAQPAPAVPAAPVTPPPTPRQEAGPRRIDRWRLGLLSVLGIAFAAAVGALLWGQLSAIGPAIPSATVPVAGTASIPSSSVVSVAAIGSPTPAAELTRVETQTPVSDTPAGVLVPDPTPARATDTPTATFITTQTATPILATPYPTPIQAGTWAMPAGDAAQSGLVDAFGRLDPVSRWSRLPLAGGGGLVVAGGLAIFGTDQGTVRGLDWVDGITRLESQSLGNNVNVSGPLGLYLGQEAQILLVPTDDQRLLALKLADLSVAWEKPAAELQGILYGGVTIGPNGILYAATDTGWLHAWNPATGQPVWPAVDLTQTDGFRQPPAVAGDSIYLAGGNQAVYKINAASRVTQWRVEIAGAPTTPASVALEAGLLFVGTASGRVHAFSLADGSEAWKVTTAGAIAGLANDGARVYATSASGNVYAWDAASGAPLWTENMSSPLSAAPLTDSHFVLVATQQGELRFLDAATGAEAVQRKLVLPDHDPILYTPAPAGGWLFVRANSIYGFGP